MKFKNKGEATMFRSLLTKYNNRATTIRSIFSISRDLDDLRIEVGRSLCGGFDGKILEDPTQAEFRVFSQFGEDGIIQYLLSVIRIPRYQHSFVEFGVETFVESNCRFLMRKDNWSGLVIDGSRKNIGRIKSSGEYWRHDLFACAAFIDRDNINQIIKDNGFSGKIGILSIDIDGNDYWVLEAVDIVEPAIIVAEYNSVLGCERALTIPYEKAFRRNAAHYSNLYWGASIKALTLLANSRGYDLVAGNTAGNNVFYVRRDLLSGLPSLSVEEAYRVSKFRESRHPNGSLTYLSGKDRAKEIAGMPLYDVELQKIVPFDVSMV